MSDRGISKRAQAAAVLLFGMCCNPAHGEPQLSDPTAPPPVDSERKESAPATLLLRSTLISETSRTALINDRVLKVGGVIDGAEVMRIEPGVVSLKRGSRTIVLRLLLPAMKTPSAAEKGQ